MAISEAVSQIIESGELDGNGAWAHKILHKAWLSCYKHEQEYDDFFCDFLVLWYKRRKNYDASRSSLCTYMRIVVDSYVQSKLRKKRRRSGLVRHDVEVDIAVYDPSNDTSPLVDAYARKRSQSVEALAKSAGMCTYDCRQELEAMADEVKRSNSRVISFKGYYC